LTGQEDQMIPSPTGSLSVSALLRQTREASEIAPLFNRPVSYPVTSMNIPAVNANVCPLFPDILYF